MKQFTVFILFLCLFLPRIKGQEALKILRIGDSNTSGYTSGSHFEDLMNDATIPWIAQGTRKSWGHQYDYNYSEGYGGTRIEFFTEFQQSYKEETLNHVPIERIFDDYTPDFIFLMIGTNNLSGKTSLDIADLKGKLNLLLNEIEARTPSTTHVLVSKIIPAADPTRNALTHQFNEEVVSVLVQERIDDNKRYHLVDNYSVLDPDIHLMDGVHANSTGYKIVNKTWFDALVPLLTNQGQEQEPFNGTPIMIPGLIQAEQYDLGGQGYAFSDSDIDNEGKAFRNDGVDIEATTDVGGGFNVGWIEGGEWLEYAIDVEESAPYSFEFRVASASSTGQFSLELDHTEIISPQSVVSTGGWQTWSSINVNNIELPQGEHTLRLKFIDGPFNINYVDISSVITNTQKEISTTAQSFPNPTSGLINVFIENRSNATYRILSVEGKVEKEGMLYKSRNQLDLSLLARGLYFLIIDDNENVYSQAITKY